MSADDFRVTSISIAEQRLQDARDACVNNDIELACEYLLEIAAFYERASLNGRAKVCRETLDELLGCKNSATAFKILDNLALGPNEQLFNWGIRGS